MFHGCNDVVVKGVRVYTRGDIMNADGIDIDCCNRVLVSGCFVDAGDDAIAVRAGSRGLRRPQPCENVVVTNCILRSDYANALRIGGGYDGAAFSGLIDDVRVTGSALEPSAFMQAADRTEVPDGVTLIIR